MPRPPLILTLLFFAISLPTPAENILFIGNSFTFGATAPAVQKNGGVPQLVAAIARAKGKHLTASAFTSPGKDWTYHLAQPLTAQALKAKTWTWVLLQDFSTRPTRIGDVNAFLRDGESFSQRIARTSPQAGIILYETWPRPAGIFYQTAPGNSFSGPAQMMSDLHQSYARLQTDLAARNRNRPVRVAPVGTAFARTAKEDSAIDLNAADRHHATAEGYYLAALVIYETIYHQSARGAPTTFFHGELVIPDNDAAELQNIADQVAAQF